MKESLWSKTLGAYTVHIVPDEFAENPYYAMDQVSEIRQPNYAERYDIGTGYDYAKYLNKNGYIADSLYLRDGAYTMAISHARIKEEWGKKGCKTINQHLIAKARKCLKAEIETFRQWAEGEVYGIVITALHPDTEEETIIDSCYGFYGWEDTEREALDMLKYAGK